MSPTLLRLPYMSITETLLNNALLAIGQQQQLWYCNDGLHIPHNTKKRLFGYFPWIKQHGDNIIQILQSHADTHNHALQFLPLKIVKNPHERHMRRRLHRFVTSAPERWRTLLYQHLQPIAPQLHGFILSLDWYPVMRSIVAVCRDLNIPTILIPHESFFMDHTQYYLCPTTGINYPDTDKVLAWGKLQSDIFIQRGYPADNILITGTPKFDALKHYQPDINRQDFFSHYQLDPHQKTILFAMQPMDAQLIPRAQAIHHQQQAIMDIVTLCQRENWQFLLRFPPSCECYPNMPPKHSSMYLLHQTYYDQLCKHPTVKLDNLQSSPMITPQDSIYHCDITLSINSTMLFESLLLGKTAIAMHYFPVEPLWSKLGLPVAHDRNDLYKIAQQISAQDITTFTPSDFARHALSNGDFDGQASHRICEYLCNSPTSYIKK